MPDVGVGTPGPTARVAESLGFGQISFAASQLLSQEFVLRDIHSHPDELRDPARGRSAADATYAANRSVGPHDPFLEVESFRACQHLLDFLHDETPVFGMLERQGFRLARRLPARIEAVDLEQLGRPVSETGGVECPAANVADSLRFGKVRFT